MATAKNRLRRARREALALHQARMHREYIPVDFPEAVLFVDRWWKDYGSAAYYEAFAHGKGCQAMDLVPDDYRSKGGLLWWAVDELIARDARRRHHGVGCS